MSEGQVLAVKPPAMGVTFWWESQDQIDLVTRTVARGATPDELALFMYTCKRTKLDALTRQIYMIERWTNRYDQASGQWKKERQMVMQTGIDGFRVIANRAKDDKGEHLYEGQTPVQWCDEKGQWYDVWLFNKYPSAAKVGVYRKGFREPIVAIARWESYAALVEKEIEGKKEKVPNAMWEKMEDGMLAKCAEALALRKAFPNDLSGLYTEDEMEQAGNDIKPVEKDPILERELERERQARETAANSERLRVDPNGHLPIPGAGKWREAVIHFGTQGGLLGKRLGNISKSQVEQVRDILRARRKLTGADRTLLAAAEEALSEAAKPVGPAEPTKAKDDIPFGEIPDDGAKGDLKGALERYVIDPAKFVGIALEREWIKGSTWGEITVEEADTILKNWDGAMKVFIAEGAAKEEGSKS